mgnify:CR=1 FL=1
MKAKVVGMKRTASEVTPEQPPDVLEEGSLSPLLKDFEGFDDFEDTTEPARAA